MNEKPNSRFPHLYLVVRIDALTDPLTLENSFSVVSAFQSRVSADAERERLFGVSEVDDSRYIVLVTRLKEGCLGPAAE